VLDGAPEVDLALLALPHELAELLLELGVLLPPHGALRRVLEGLDRQVDLAVLLDGDHLCLDAVVLPEVLADVLDVVPIDLGDVDQADGPGVELNEGPVRGDALDGPFNDRPDL
jgi:hypothetical protein